MKAIRISGTLGILTRWVGNTGTRKQPDMPQYYRSIYNICSQCENISNCTLHQKYPWF